MSPSAHPLVLSSSSPSPTAITSHYRMDLAYDGRNYLGFQSQKNRRTIQDHLEGALSTLMRRPRVAITGASRTDSQVSAYHQVCSFTTATSWSTDYFMQRLNGILDPTIRIHHLCTVPSDFHPIRSSTGKVYRYLLWNGPCHDPFITPQVWTLHKGFDHHRLQGELQKVVGTHDFSSFAQQPSTVQSPIRTLYSIHTLYHHPPLVEIWMHGQGFLRGMVRNIVGSAITLAQTPSHHLPPPSLTCLKKILEAHQRRSAYRKAPAHALTLMKCLYPEDPPWQLPAHQKTLYPINPLIS